MIRFLDSSGGLHTAGGWSEALALSRSGAAWLDVEIGIAESTGVTTEALAAIREALPDWGVVRVQGVHPAQSANGANRTLIRLAEQAGLTFVSSEPQLLQEHEFLAGFPGFANEWLGLEGTAAARFVEIVFQKRPSPEGGKRFRLAIITQDLYYSFMYESPALASLFDIRKMEYNPFCAPEHYQPLLDFKPDALLVFRPDYLAPETFRAFHCPVIGYASEPLPRFIDGRVIASDYNEKVYALLQKVRGLCSHLYHYDPAGIEFLRREGFPVQGLFPPCVCTDVYRPNPALPPRWDAVFIGKSTPRREEFLFQLHLQCRFFHGAHGLEGARDVLPFLQRTKIGLNIHRDETPNVEPRIPILMACGVLVLSEPLADNPWFREDVHYAAFRSKEELVEKVRYYLAHEDERRRIAEAGRRWVCENASSLVVLPRMIAQVLRHD